MVNKSKDFKNQNIVITGGRNGIGEEILKGFLSQGANVICIDKENVNTDDHEYGNKLKYIQYDFSDCNNISQLCDEILSEHKEIHHLINNVGLFNGKGLSASLEEWYECLNVNIIANMFLTKNLVNSMINGKSTITNIASISGIIAQKNYLLYSTMKGALISATKCLALDLGESRKIRVNSVSPGTVWTKMNEYYIGESHGLLKEDADIHPDFGGGNMLKRVAHPSEIANCVLFLSSDNASFITGENLVVDGGFIHK